MGYVMVPVPEEHVQEAMAVILRIINRARLSDWDAEALNRLFESIDEPSRAVLSAVARASVAGKTMADTEVAAVTELPQREVMSIVRELNEAASEADRVVLVSSQQDTEVLPNGRTRDRRVLTIGRDLALLVTDAQRAELEAAPHPLLRDER